MLAYRAWRREFCPRCGQRRHEWLDANGVELRDPPFEVAETFCPPCDLIADYQEGRPKDQRAGVIPYIKRLDDEEG